VKKLTFVALLIGASVAHAEPFAIAHTALGGLIVLENSHCDAPLEQWRHFALSRADGMVVGGGCWYLSRDHKSVVARDGATLEPIVWSADDFMMLARK
jgi:hypothetical protein